MTKQNIEELIESNEGKSSIKNLVIQTITILFILFVFLLSLKLMGSGFKLFGKEIAQEIINSTANPFVSLLIGLLATAIVQSSSTTTSMIVAMVAAGTLTLDGAVPMIMGANIGTSVTSSIVSFGHITKKKEYRKAIAAATVHDFFNIMVAMILFPLEMTFGFLSKIAISLSSFFVSPRAEETEIFSIMDVTVKPIAKIIIDLLDKNPWIVLVVSILLLFFSLRMLTNILKKILIGRAKESLNKMVFKKPIRALLWGFGITTGVQSSSVTTSLIVPMVASNKVSLKKAFPFLMGANIGTTTTALIASFSKPELALSIAFVHVLFNFIGVFIFFPIPIMRNIPLRLARKLGKASLKNRAVGFIYVLLVFFVIPFLLIFITRSETIVKKYTYYELQGSKKDSTYSIIFGTKNKELKQMQLEVFDNLKEKAVAPEAKTSAKIIVERKASQLVTYGSEFLMLNKENYSWDQEDLNGNKVSYIVKGIKKNEKISAGYTAENCYIFKRFYEDTSIEDFYTILYFDTDEMLFVKEEIYSSSNELLKEKVLLGIKN